MKTKQLLLIALLAVVALLAAGLVAVRSLDTEEADSASDEIDLAPFAPADIEAFGYTFGGETLEFASKETPAEDESSSETETTWYLTDDPDYELDQSAISTMLVALAEHVPTTVIAGTCGIPEADAEVAASLARLGVHPDTTAAAIPVAAGSTTIVTTSDADEEVRAAVRAAWPEADSV